MDNRFQDNTADQVATFYQSQVWKLIKARLENYIARLESSSLDATRKFQKDTAVYYAVLADGVKGAIMVTEGLSGEIQTGSLDVDAALHVIEKKIEYEGKEKETWLTKLLGKRDNHKNQK